MLLSTDKYETAALTKVLAHAHRAAVALGEVRGANAELAVPTMLHALAEQQVKQEDGRTQLQASALDTVAVVAAAADETSVADVDCATTENTEGSQTTKQAIGQATVAGRGDKAGMQQAPGSVQK